MAGSPALRRVLSARLCAIGSARAGRKREKRLRYDLAPLRADVLQNLTCPTSTCCAAQSHSHADGSDFAGEQSNDNGFELQERLIDGKLYSSQSPDHIGAEYGQGFVQFTARGASERLDVDELNKRLAVKGQLRLRHSMKPDEGYGCIVCFDGVVCNTQRLKREVWQHVADRRGLKFPHVERPQMYGMSAERAVMDVLQWTRDIQTARAMASDVTSEFAQRFQSLQHAEKGVAVWLQALEAARVPCALVFNLDRHTLASTLQRLGIEHRFQVAVTAEDGMETRSQQLLSAAIKLGRPPNKCVAFVADTQGVTAAHNTSMRAVAVAGVLPGYQLRTADLMCGSLEELKVYSLRRLFANEGNEMMDSKRVGLAHSTRSRKPAAVGSLQPP